MGACKGGRRLSHKRRPARIGARRPEEYYKNTHMGMFITTAWCGRRPAQPSQRETRVALLFPPPASLLVRRSSHTPSAPNPPLGRRAQDADAHDPQLHRRAQPAPAAPG